ncbi:hypothetical protein TNCT_2851 [Trichonephila clavata]|uniref:Uncharacterized protein n=1 Tax=Trichonephila clavata TaxID=2740835 RepID=A0A8X6H1B5_TRICU|nr:hypothetical protein TNCT_2851 [Trichonephila clavata]
MGKLSTVDSFHQPPDFCPPTVDSSRWSHKGFPSCYFIVLPNLQIRLSCMPSKDSSILVLLSPVRKIPFQRTQEFYRYKLQSRFDSGTL